MENENSGNEVLTLREVARILKCRTNQIYELSRRREVGRVCIQTGQRSMGMAEGGATRPSRVKGCLRFSALSRYGKPVGLMLGGLPDKTGGKPDIADKVTRWTTTQHSTHITVSE